jgi:predicted phage-related endonuclease
MTMNNKLNELLDQYAQIDVILKEVQYQHKELSHQIKELLNVPQTIKVKTNMHYYSIAYSVFDIKTLNTKKLKVEQEKIYQMYTQVKEQERLTIKIVF